MSGLAITKVDVLTGMDEIQVCVAYERGGKRVEDLPYDGLGEVTPVYESFPGWTESIANCRALHELPKTHCATCARSKISSGVKRGS